MASLESQLADGLRAGSVPSNGAELVRYAGGRRALTEQLSGMSGPPKRSAYSDPDSYKAASTRWRTSSRRAQRWDDAGAPGKQRRGGSKSVELPPATKGRLRREATIRKRRAMVRDGLRARLYATVTVDSPKARGGGTRKRVMPAQGSPGVYLSGGDVEEVLEQLGDDGREAAAEEFLPLFMESYGVDPEILQLDRVERLKLWPEGTREPE